MISCESGRLIEKSNRLDLCVLDMYDDLSGAGNLRTWWENIVTLGPKLGYQSWLVVKPEAEDEVQQIFADTNIRKTTEGRKYLGASLVERLVSPNISMN